MKHDDKVTDAENRVKSPHSFHIPVMGTGFSVDMPLKVGRFGISSVISIGDDMLLEKMRRFHAEKAGVPFEPIAANEKDSRCRRITAYLDLVHDLLARQVKRLQEMPFTEESEITRYFRMLPDSSRLKRRYLEMVNTDDPGEKSELQDELRIQAVPGEIDVNIMTKVDPDRYEDGQQVDPKFGLALSSFRGFAKSKLNSKLVLSAGLNRRLFNYIPNYKDFLPNNTGELHKKIVLKVSDFRSALIQARYLAKRGLWVSEFRIESGLNCGGHAFGAKGQLLGTILDEFRLKRQEMTEKLQGIFDKTQKNCNDALKAILPRFRVTVQGGIGTAEEDRQLQEHFQVDGTGWGTPFMLVPEVTNIDEASLQKLVEAEEDDVQLSANSPLGLPFWSLKTSASEWMRRLRIRQGKPGSACPKGLLCLNKEFSETEICIASQKYQAQKLAELEADADRTVEQKSFLRQGILDKTCLCRDLASSATGPYDLESKTTPAVCCGPSIASFNKIAKLEEMVDHIYGRLSLLPDSERSHMFIKELKLSVDELKGEMTKYRLKLSDRSQEYFDEFKGNLLNGIDYYRSNCTTFIQEGRERFERDLETIEAEIRRLTVLPTA
ncbi:MAG: hypothetical protein GY835_14235 [bacterium]|nr:hypothetical protein [bacterium]